MEIDVLGTTYTIKRVDHGQDYFMDKMQVSGYCMAHAKCIVILNLKSHPDWKDDPETAIKAAEKETLRHELIHAFFNESGLQDSTMHTACGWAKNEEMVDWIAIQFPKILKAFKDADAL